MSKLRVQCFVDGFNLYHAIDDLKKNHYKWVCLKSLSSAFVRPSKEVIADVFYFTAYATWRPDAMTRHREYVTALKTRGVTPILGQFKEKDMRCYTCKGSWKAREEKESDVNLAIHLLHNAYQNNFDKALIITADSDLCPAIDLAIAHFPQKHFTVLTPPNRYRIARNIRGKVETIRIREKHLIANLLPEKEHDGDGSLIYSRPLKYNPPI